MRFELLTGHDEANDFTADLPDGQNSPRAFSPSLACPAHRQKIFRFTAG
jgi:hypothetical protein